MGAQGPDDYGRPAGVDEIFFFRSPSPPSAAGPAEANPKAFCFDFPRDECFSGNCCRDENCNIRHDGSKPFWDVLMQRKVSPDGDECRTGFGATVAGDTHCTQRRGQGASPDGLAVQANREARTEEDRHRVDHTYTCWYNIKKCGGNDAEQEVLWSILNKKAWFIAMMFFLCLGGVIWVLELLFVLYFWCCVPGVNAVRRKAHNTQFVAPVDPPGMVFNGPLPAYVEGPATFHDEPQPAVYPNDPPPPSYVDEAPRGMVQKPASYGSTTQRPAEEFDDTLVE